MQKENKSEMFFYMIYNCTNNHESNRVFTCLQLCNVLTALPEFAKIIHNNGWMNNLSPTVSILYILIKIVLMQNLKIRLKYDSDTFDYSFQPKDALANCKE